MTFAAAPAQAGVPDPGPQGQVRYMQVADSSFDRYLTDSSSAERNWMREHYWRMRGWAGFFTKYALDWAPPSHFYRDLYAIYNSSSGMDFIEQHPNWVLRDSQGDELYIDYDCSGGTCPQYAADIGSPGFRADWIERARSDLDEGYRGIYVDDVNLLMRVSDGSGRFVRPVDRRTGQPMTDTAWRRYMAEFTEQIRAAFPDAEISHNPLWWMDHDDPYAKRQTDAADLVQLERGFNDQGIVDGDGKWGYETYLSHVDWLHARGKAVIYKPRGLDSVSRVFELASYFLVNGGRDVIASSSEGLPDDWWAGWETDLGAAKGGRYVWKGVLTRDFERGRVFVNQPQSPTARVRLPRNRRWTTLEGKRVTDLTLDSREGAVLYKKSSTPKVSLKVNHVSLKAGRRRISKGARLVLKGRAPGARRVAVRARHHGRWRTVARPRVSSGHRYRSRVRARPSGRIRYRANAPGLRRSRVVQVRITRR